MEIVLKYFVKMGTIDWPKMTVVGEDLLKFAGNGLKPKAKMTKFRKVVISNWKDWEIELT